MTVAAPIPFRSPLTSSLAGETVVISGGTSGIGLAAGTLLRSIGARVVLIGRDAPLIRQALEGAGVTLVDAESMDAAVVQANQRAHAGDAVLMSPACASFDMFNNYGHRAQVFVQAVHQLALDAGQDLEGTA